MKQSRTLKKILFILLDAIIIVLSGVVTTWLITGTTDLEMYKWSLLIYFPLEIILVIFIFKLLKLYHSLWRYAGFAEFINIIIACVSISLINLTVILCCKIFLSDFATNHNIELLPIRFPIINGILMVCLVAMSRFSYRVLRYILQSTKTLQKDHQGLRVMIIGAGDAGCTIVKELQSSNKITKTAVCMIDDDKTKKNTYIEGVPVVGNRNDIIEMAKKYEVAEIIIAIPSLSAKAKADILNICKETKCKVKVIPGIYEFVNGTASIAKARDVEIVDLLGREQIKVNLDEILGYIERRVVLVTGGGGSIGSELCRQIATHNPKQLIIVDIYENNAYDIEQELKRRLPNLNLLVLIASIRDKGKVEDIFNKYHPDIVFNAAAHKHVPLMETSPNEAIKNNVFGTLNVARAADKYGTKRFVQISTDKAVNPTSIMGASKRICEMMIQTIGRHSKNCEFVAVRFGNVLGSNGSVIPLFKKQISEGGPVTVTHQDIIRYFMTIPEAVSLVLQAGVYAKGGEIYVLDMGEPVRIYDLALNLIKLSGYTPGVDMEIKITGLRPGEKLYEERLMAEEGMQKTANGLISIAKPIDLDEDKLWDSLDKIYKAAYEETGEMKKLVKQIVSTYKIDE
jgi:putative epimerase/dehydratase wbiI